MHISEGILTLPQSVGWFAVATPFVWKSAQKMRVQSQNGTDRVFVGLVIALCFAVTLLPLPVPVVGATSHICGTPLFALLRGPVFMVFPTAIILFVQALFFSHGGLTSLGANIFTLGVIGPFTAVFLFEVLKRITRGFSMGFKGVEAASVFLSCFFADLAVYSADAGILGLALGKDSSFWKVTQAVLLGFAPVQLPLAILEGMVSFLLYNEIKKRNPLLISRRLGILFLLSVILSGSPIAHAGNFEGIDDSVMGEIARAYGKKPGPAWEWTSNEITLFVFSAGNFLAGWWAGWSWSVLWGKERRNDS